MRVWGHDAGEERGVGCILRRNRIGRKEGSDGRSEGRNVTIPIGRWDRSAGGDRYEMSKHESRHSTAGEKGSPRTQSGRLVHGSEQGRGDMAR